MTLSARLEAILEEVAAADRRPRVLIDLCADHAQLALGAVARDLCRRAIAIELREAPLFEARKLLRRSKLGARVLLMRGDGLQMIRRADALVIAGVGGDLAAQLLARSKNAAQVSRLIVQPNRHSREVRLWARENGFHLVHERVAAEQRTLHLILSFVRRAGIDPAYGEHSIEAELQLGPKLIESREVTSRAFLLREKKRFEQLISHQPELQPALDVLGRLFPKPKAQPPKPL